MPGDRSSMFFDVRPGECIVLAGCSVEVISKSGRSSRLRVVAPREVKVEFQEAIEDPDGWLLGGARVTNGVTNA